MIEEVIEFLERGDLDELCDAEDVIEAIWKVADPEACRVARVLHEAKVAALGRFAEHREWSPVPPEHEREAW